MDLNVATFRAAWEAAAPRLRQEPLIQDGWWGSMTLSAIFTALEKALAAVTTVEALFERLYDVPEVGIIPYAALYVLRPLVAPATQPATALAGDLAIESCQVILGDAIVSGSVQNNGALVVFGDLTIEGIYGDAAWDWSVLAVGGSVRARGLVSSGDCLIAGDVLVSDVVYGHYNDNPLLVGGTLRARILLEDQHYTRASAREVQETVSRADRARLRELFVEALFDDDDDDDDNGRALSTDLLFDHLEQGLDIYRS